MTSNVWLDKIPLWAVFLLTVLPVLFVIRIGMYFGQRRSRRPDHETEAPVGTSICRTGINAGTFLADKPARSKFDHSQTIRRHPWFNCETCENE